MLKAFNLVDYRAIVTTNPSESVAVSTKNTNPFSLHSDSRSNIPNLPFNVSLVSDSKYLENALFYRMGVRPVELNIYQLVLAYGRY